MTTALHTSIDAGYFGTQPADVRGLAQLERDSLIISAAEVGGQWTILSRYGDPIWKMTGGTTNTSAHDRVVKFELVPAPYRETVKGLLFRYLRRGRRGFKPPAGPRLRALLFAALPFLRHIQQLGIARFSEVTPLACFTYVTACKELRQTRQSKGAPLRVGSLFNLFSAVEAFYELSQFTDDPIPHHPWVETSAAHLAGLTGAGAPHKNRSKTPLIPDDVFSALFQRAEAVVQRGGEFLDMRDALDAVAQEYAGSGKIAVKQAKYRALRKMGWSGTLRDFNVQLRELRTAAYVVVASLSGCRNHELAYIQSGSCYLREDDAGEQYWWMRSQSTKTEAGHTEWMVPEAAVQALRMMDRWALPSQALLQAEIAQRRSANPHDPEIAEAMKHADAIFLGSTNSAHDVRTLTAAQWTAELKAFAKKCGLKWSLASHQFRRKFANYAARSQFGDLRYLREHFKHWSQDMTNDAYAINESADLDLYLEIQEELDELKTGVVAQWLLPNEPLAGGYGANLVAWRGRHEQVALFKSHDEMVRSVAQSTAIRSNGHAWCTADDRGCVGNSLEKSRCGGCDNAVISRGHARLYQRLYQDLSDVLACPDIGAGGRERVERDLERCAEVLSSLGYEREVSAA